MYYTYIFAISANIINFRGVIKLGSLVYIKNTTGNVLDINCLCKLKLAIKDIPSSASSFQGHKKASAFEADLAPDPLQSFHRNNQQLRLVFRIVS